MMSWYYIDDINLITSTLLPVIAGAVRYKILDKGSRIFFYWTVANFLVESVACLAAVCWHNNLVVYNIGNIIELFIIAIYFNYTVKAFRRRNIGIYIGIGCVAAGILNDTFLESWTSIDHFFLLLEALTVITMSMTAILAYFNFSYNGKLTNEVHFWFRVTLIFFWGISYFLFTLVDYYSTRLHTVAPALIVALPLVAILTNLAIATVFFLYPKLHVYV